MIGRIIALIGVFLLLFIGAAALYTFVFAAPEPEVARKPVVKQKWDGKGVKTYNASWTRPCGINCSEKTELVDMSFTGLNGNATSIVARFVVTPQSLATSQGKALTLPVWVKSQNFVIQSRDNKFWSTVVKPELDADKYIVSVTMQGLPSELLAPRAASTTENQLNLLIAIPKRAIAIGLEAPEPSVADAKFAETDEGVALPGRVPNANDKRIAAAVAR